MLNIIKSFEVVNILKKKIEFYFLIEKDSITLTKN